MTAQASDAIVYEKPTDTSVVDPVFNQFLSEKARVIRALSASNVIEIGKHLSEVRSALSQKGGAHKGGWLRWLKRELGWSEHTARRYINVFEVFGSNATHVSHWNLPLRSLYELAAPTTPEPARLHVLGCVEAGKKLPYREIKAIMAAHTLKQDQPQLEQPEAHVAVPVEKVCASAAPRRESVSVGRVPKETPDRDELSDTEKINYLENKLAKAPVKDNTKHVTPEVSKEDEKQTSKFEVDQKSDPESETMDLQVEEATDKKADELVAGPELEVLRLMSQLIDAVEFIGSLESKFRALEEELKTVKGLVDNSDVGKPVVEKTQELLEKQRDPPLRMKVIREFYPRA